MINDVPGTVRGFIFERFPAASSEMSIGDTTSFLESGLIDSMGVLELIDFLEERFQIVVEDSDLIPENLDSIHNICTYLESKKNKLR
jgi:acyl carrier protein